MRILLFLALPILALPFITVHVCAHPLQLAARAPTSGDVQIMARAPPAATDSQSEANGQSPPRTNGHSPVNGNTPTNGDARPLPGDHQVFTQLGGLRLGISLYYDHDVTYTEEDKQSWLQSLFALLTGAYGEVPPSPRAQEETLLRSLKARASELNIAMQSYRDYSQPGANGQASDRQATNGHATNGHATNGHATNGHANGNSPGPNGHTQTNRNPDMDPARVRVVVSSYYAANIVAAKGKYLQELLSILTNGEVPRNGVEREQNLLHSLKVHGMGFTATMHEVHVYNQEFRRASFAESLRADFRNVFRTT